MLCVLWKKVKFVSIWGGKFIWVNYSEWVVWNLSESPVWRGKNKKILERYPEEIFKAPWWWLQNGWTPSIPILDHWKTSHCSKFVVQKMPRIRRWSTGRWKSRLLGLPPHVNRQLFNDHIVTDVFKALLMVVGIFSEVFFFQKVHPFYPCSARKASLWAKLPWKWQRSWCKESGEGWIVWMKGFIG